MSQMTCCPCKGPHRYVSIIHQRSSWPCKETWTVLFFFLFIKFIQGWITRTLKWTHTQLFLNFAFHVCQCVNAWNSFLKEKLHKANSGHGKGDCFKIPTFVARYKNELLAEYQKLTPIQKQDMIAKVQVAHEAKGLPAHTNPRLLTKPSPLHFQGWIRRFGCLF